MTQNTRVTNTPNTSKTSTTNTAPSATQLGQNDKNKQVQPGTSNANPNAAGQNNRSSDAAKKTTNS